MTATDELRRLLDERGVEWQDRDMFGKHVFHWGEPLHGAMFTDGGEWTELVVENATPEQAVEATLGRGTCRNISHKLGNDEFTCDECLARVYGSGGQWFDANWKYHKFNYCPNCGRKVLDA